MNATADMRQSRLIPVLLELLGGGIAGAVLGILGGMLMGEFGSGRQDWPLELVQALFAAALGLILGAAGGVTMAGRWFRQRGSFWLALAGAVLGAAAVLLLAEPLQLNRNATLLLAVFGLAVVSLATLGYNLRRRA
jgi:uncharacterized membrane protein HdeD (DUF308 family)